MIVPLHDRPRSRSALPLATTIMKLLLEEDFVEMARRPWTVLLTVDSESLFQPDSANFGQYSIDKIAVLFESAKFEPVNKDVRGNRGEGDDRVNGTGGKATPALRLHR